MRIIERREIKNWLEIQGINVSFTSITKEFYTNEIQMIRFNRIVLNRIGL